MEALVPRLSGLHFGRTRNNASGSCSFRSMGRTGLESRLHGRARRAALAPFRSRGTVTVLASSSSQPDPRDQRHRGLRLSLFTVYPNLPPDGMIVNEKDETCDPSSAFKCRTPVFVYEEKCKPCGGTGYARNGGRKSKGSRLSVCAACTGLGFVRCTTTVEPANRNDLCDKTLLREEE